MGVCMCALARARACWVHLFGTLGASITLAMVFLCASAVMGAAYCHTGRRRCRGPRCFGRGSLRAIEVAVAGQTLGALAGVAILVFCLVSVRTRATLRTAG